MQYREFGNTGIKVSEIGFGARAIGGNEHGMCYGNVDEKAALDALQKAFDSGCNFFDTADVYGWGRSEELIGRCFKGKRDKVIIATKVGSDFYQGVGFQTFSPEYIRFALNKSLVRLKTDYIDIYQLHNPSLRVVSTSTVYEVLHQLKKEGKIRAWGVSILNPVEGLSALAVGKPDSIQIPYNIFNTTPAEELFPIAFERGTAIIAREPLANGFLSGKYKDTANFAAGDMRANWPVEYLRARILASERLNFLGKNGRTQAQSALRFTLANKHVSVVIVGSKSALQCEENCLASETSSLSSEELSAIEQLKENRFDLR